MASLKAITYSSNSIVGKDGRYLSLTVTQVSSNSLNNTSEITWELSTNGGDTTYYDTYCLLQINGEQVYFSNGTASLGGYNGWVVSNAGGVWVNKNDSEYTCAKWGFLASGNLTVLHNEDGTKDLNVRFLVGCSYPVVKDCGSIFNLVSIDRTQPILTQNNPSNINYSSCTISTNSNVKCDLWWYRKKLYASGIWDNWISVSNSSAVTSKSISVSGLTPGEEYNFQWKSRKASNQITGESDVVYVKTLGASILNSISENVYLDITNPSFNYNITVYSSNFYNQLIFTKNGKLLTINLGKISASGKYTYTLTSAQITELLSWISTTDQSYSTTGIDVALYTYPNSNYSTSQQIGSASSLSGAFSVSIHKENALPTLTVGGYTSNYSGNNQLVIPNSSTVTINNISATTYLNATISSLVIKSPNNGVTKTISTSGTSYSTSSYSWGKIATEYASYLEVTLTDSRGNVVTVPLPLNVYREGPIIKPADYNNWRTILKPHFDAKDYENNYYITGSTYGFDLTTKSTGKTIWGIDVGGTSDSIKSHVNAIKNCSYYNTVTEVSTACDNLLSAVNNITRGKEILKSTKDTIDNSLNTIDQIVLFNLIKG